MSIYWKPEYSVGVREIDDQHKELVEIIKKIYRSLKQNKVKNEIEDILKDLTKYAQIHFATEEKYFRKFKYENTQEHEREHQKFKDEVSRLTKKLDDDRLKVSFNTADFLEDWLLDHLITQDQKYVECFKQNGLK